MPGKKNAEPAPAAVPPQPAPMPPVKVFRLNDGGGWEDYGAGRVTIDYLEVWHTPVHQRFAVLPCVQHTIDYLEGSTSATETALAVIDAENKETMLLHLITPDDIYRRHQGTFISWFDPEIGLSISLSFLDTAACSDVWDTICQVRRKLRPDGW